MVADAPEQREPCGRIPAAPVARWWTSGELETAFMTGPAKCSKCPCPASPSHPRCSRCRKQKPCPLATAPAASTPRVHEEGKTAAKGTETPKAADAPVRFDPYPGGPPPDVPTWWASYLVNGATIGGRTRSAYDVGVKRRDVRRLLDSRPDLAEDEDDAINYFADTLAVELPNSKTPIGRIARLKSIRPEEYETALLVQNVTNNLLHIGAPASLGDPRELLREMLQHVTPATRALLAESPVTGLSEIIDAETDA